MCNPLSVSDMSSRVITPDISVSTVEEIFNPQYISPSLMQISCTHKHQTGHQASYSFMDLEAKIWVQNPTFFEDEFEIWIPESYSRLYQICRGLIFRVSLTPLGSNFYYDIAFMYRVYWTVLKVPREIFGPRMVFLRFCDTTSIASILHTIVDKLKMTP